MGPLDKQEKITRTVGTASDYCFADLHFHLGKGTHARSIDTVIDNLERSADILAITGRGIGWASEKFEYSFDQFVDDATHARAWKIEELSPGVVRAGQGDRSIMFVDNQETVTAEEIELITFSKQKFTKHVTAQDIVDTVKGGLSILPHPGAHPCRYGLNFDRVYRLKDALSRVTAIEGYNQATRPLYLGFLDKTTDRLARELGKPTISTSDCHNYSGRFPRTSGIVIPRSEIAEHDVVGSLHKAITQGSYDQYRCTDAADLLEFLHLNRIEFKMLMSGESPPRDLYKKQAREGGCVLEI